MPSPIRANDNRPRPSRGDSLRATAARPDGDPHLAQLLRDAAALADRLDHQVVPAGTVQAEVVDSMQELIDALERSISRLQQAIGQSGR